MSTASGTGPSRRAFLAAVPVVSAGAAVLAAAAGCTGSAPTAPGPTASPADVAAATDAHARETALLAAYDTAIDEHPALAGALRAIRAHHADHARALVALGLPGVGAVAGSGRPNSAAGSGSIGPSTTTGPASVGGSTGPPGTAMVPPPADGIPAGDTVAARAAALSALAGLEHTTATAHRTGALAAGSGLAPLLGSLCAAESGHAELVAAAGGAADGALAGGPATDDASTAGEGQAGGAAAVAALATMLSAAHAAVFATAAAGGALAPLGAPAQPARSLARAAHDDHRALRDVLVAALRAHGTTPPAALPAYRLPVEPAGVEGSVDLLSRVEDQSAVSAGAAVGALTGADRELAVDALVAMALRGQRARLAAGVAPEAAGPAFPGR
ncbi:DUF4439 domain-containing protein [Parafrankia sp. FMc2]|uniref:DUF4439 domain-containing protein n=1 Tax=Parafrankia sp. FMc2 TaxID=3233196 RepID=UPI0034D3F72F